MALPTASDNIFPKLILDEGGTLGTVTAGERRLAIDANGVLVWKNSAGTTSPLVALNKWDATSAPTANEDSGDGYQVGSRWIDVTNNKEYVCLDATVAAAVWTETTQTGVGSSAFVGAKAYRAAPQTLTTGTATAITLDTEEYDTSAFHDNVTNPSRFTIPAGAAGYYDLKGKLTFASTSLVGERQIWFHKNGAIIRGSTVTYEPEAGILVQVMTTVDVYLAVGDYVETIGYQTSGGNLDVGHATQADWQSTFSVAFRGA